LTLSSVQQAQIMGPGQSPGQRLSVPLKMVLQPQVRDLHSKEKRENNPLVPCHCTQQQRVVDCGDTLNLYI
jgi:hypothetical protein